MTQTNKVLSLLREHHEITQRDAFSIGVYRLGARIYDLKRAGYLIASTPRRVHNADGSESTIAAYSLVGEPDA